MQGSVTQRCLAFCRRTPGRTARITLACRLLPWLTVALYGGLLLFWALQKQPEQFWRVLLIPLGELAAATLLRFALDLPRPCEKEDIVPLLPHRPGRSCPSRHASSAAVITCACFYTCWPLGVAAAVLALIVAGTRVVSGVHAVRDVVCGLLFGGLWGALLFFWI
ncbi:MAG: phosphatase PAP2 family protein [Clostridia bacterium]|nr:phosphatase PAP2 family protein [Clostridia bacterium]